MSFRIDHTIVALGFAIVVGTALPAASQPISVQDQVSELFAQTCAIPGCHAGPIPQQDMELTPERYLASTVGVPSKGAPEFLRVHPGNAEDSYLYMKLIGDSRISGVQMPLTGNKLSEDELGLIREWIQTLTDESVEEARQSAALVPEEAPYDFLGWKVVNLPTNRRVEKGLFLFLIGHRFNPRLSSGYDSFFGLDGSGIIFLNFGYAVSDRFFLNLGRSNAQDDVELDAKYLIADERAGVYPLSASVHASLNWISEKIADESRLRGATISPSMQLILTKAIGDRGGVAVVPGILLNPDSRASGESPFVTVGLGGRLRLGQRFSIVGEWVPIVSGFERSSLFGNDIRFDSWAGGIEIATTGHVFQIVGSNTVGLTTDQYFRGGDLDLTEGQIRLGFNIFRVLRF